MDKSLENKKILIYILIIVFCVMGAFTYQIAKDLYNKSIESNALLVADIIISQRKVIRNVYSREIIAKLRADGTGAHTNYKDMPGYIPVPAQFNTLLSQEADQVMKNIRYRSVSKWNMGPYSIHGDPFLEWGWQQLEQQDKQVTDKPYNWQPIWRVEETPQGPVLRYLDAVPASAESCVDCHQAYENEPDIRHLREQHGVDSHQFRVNHLIGAFNIDIPLNSSQQLIDTHLNNFILWLSVLMAACFAIVFWFSTHSLRQLKDLLVLTQQSHHDQLTGLMNRRGFNRSLEQHIRLLDVDDKVFSLCVFDLDGFKLINDTHGHQAGDELLKEIASVLRKTFRDNDVLVRLGGDEFCIILDGCDINNANMLCHKLLSNIHNIHLEWGEARLTIGASIGVYECSDSKMNIDNIFEQADAACYAAKHSGKNRVEIAT